MGYYFEKKMNCLPEQLMASFCRVSSQQWFFGLSRELSCALKIDMSRQWRQHEFSSTSLVKGQPIPFLKLGTVAGNLQDPLPIQAQRIKFNVLKRSIRMIGRGIRQAFFEKKQQITSPSEANSPSRAIHKGWTDPQKRWERHSYHQELKRVEDRLTLIQSCKQREGRSDPS